MLSFWDIFWTFLLPLSTFVLYEIYFFQSKKEHKSGKSASDGINETINKKVEQKLDGSWKTNTPSSDGLDKKLSGSVDEVNEKGRGDKKQQETTPENSLLTLTTEIVSRIMERDKVEKNRSEEKGTIVDAAPPPQAGGKHACNTLQDEVEKRESTLRKRLETRRQEEPKGDNPQEELIKIKKGNYDMDEDAPPSATSLPASSAIQEIISSSAFPSSRGARLHRPTIVIAYASHSRTCLSFAHRLFNSLQTSLFEPQASSSPSVPSSLPSLDEENKLLIPDIKVMELMEEDVLGLSSSSILEEKFLVFTIFIVSTFTGGKAPPRSQSFELLLQDAYQDHRVPRDVLSRKRFALFGLGDIAYGDHEFNRFAKNLCIWCKGLGAPSFVIPPIYATVRVQEELFQRFSYSLLLWVRRASFTADGQVTAGGSLSSKEKKKSKSRKDKNTIRGAVGNTSSLCVANALSDCGSPGDDGDNAEEEQIELEEASSSSSSISSSDLEDVEDIVGYDLNDEMGEGNLMELPELLYPKLRQNLTKQGYQLIGSHSGVKLCRWTKSMLRGRGGCYKHTFYNINSSQCMEMTPSLACANKCIFCWRHHTNPVSRHFRWKQDPPAFLLSNGMRLHYQMVKQMRGVPGVTPERLADAMNIRHCALSLVGEPIMYPQINEFCQLLHENRISSFMVTNAQFPDQLRDLQPVVQLYLSIDAATPEELKRIDRPLFEDYWERCLQCVQELRKKQQRTVFRLTLVNEYNAGNIKSYADLVMQGWPDFVEVKGVTYCGTSNSSTLTMKANVPRHDEVIRFCSDLCEELARRHPNYVSHIPREESILFMSDVEKGRPYNIACEHEHSCCVLVALDKFVIDGKWHTWIDYDRFFALVEEGRTDFTSLDYCAPTPSWAVYRSPEAGFDPQQVRVTKTGKPRPTAPERNDTENVSNEICPKN